MSLIDVIVQPDGTMRAFFDLRTAPLHPAQHDLDRIERAFERADAWSAGRGSVLAGGAVIYGSARNSGPPLRRLPALAR